MTEMQNRAVSNRCRLVSTVVKARYARNMISHIKKVEKLLKGCLEYKTPKAVYSIKISSSLPIGPTDSTRPRRFASALAATTAPTARIGAIYSGNSGMTATISSASNHGWLSVCFHSSSRALIRVPLSHNFTKTHLVLWHYNTSGNWIQCLLQSCYHF